MADYDFEHLQQKWRQRWQEQKQTLTDLTDFEKKCYCLVMFPYPSGDKLHLGHWMNYAPADAWARFRRLRGYNVFLPIGFDSFGLPAENFAIKMGVHPRIHTEENITFIHDQLQSLSGMYDWSSNLATHRPEYYRWNQWLFLQLYKNDLAYRSDMPVNWCPSCQTVLANEQVVDGECERCGSLVERQNRTQWCFRITRYADRLLEGLETIDWPLETKKKQTAWIGRSEGAEVVFELPAESVVGPVPDSCATEPDGSIRLPVFTTRPDTLFGVTYMVLAPEHPLVSTLTTSAQQPAVREYIQQASKLSEVDRARDAREKTGVPTGAVAINPVNGERIPVWVADYVLASYGTGAVMAVPAHDIRDFAFATAFDLPIRRVILGGEALADTPLTEAYTDAGDMINSRAYDGLPSPEGGQKIVEDLAQQGMGKATVQYRLRDWLVSRQRYWGTPIPIVYCSDCGTVPVPEDQLPIPLPDDADYKPKGKSPLASSETYMHTICPQCGGHAERDPDTMDTFVCSSWYFLRYLDPENNELPIGPEVARDWLPIDQYIGGVDHAYGHLIFSRFITKVLYDLGYLPVDEPFQRLVHQGMIMSGGEKMSKSKGNVVHPEQYIQKYGTDVLRTYIMFGFAFTEGGDWVDEGIEGVAKFLNRIWRLIDCAIAGRSPAGDLKGEGEPLSSVEAEKRGGELRAILHNSIKGCTLDSERFQFNTAISRLMELTNGLYAYAGRNAVNLDDKFYSECIETLVVMLSPFAPHIGEEMWERLGGDKSVFEQNWPEWDEKLLMRNTVTIVVQINGKIRDKLEVQKDETRETLQELALASGRIPELIGDQTVRKVIVVPNKLVNIVV